MRTIQSSTIEVLLCSPPAPVPMLCWQWHLNHCSCLSAPGSEGTVTSRPSRNKECHFPGPLCSVSHTHICIHSQLVSTLPVLFACLALGVAPRAFCSPLLSPRRKVDHSNSNMLPNANWQVAGVKGGCDTAGYSQQAGNQGTRLAPTVAASNRQQQPESRRLNPPVISHNLGIFSEWLEY